MNADAAPPSNPRARSTTAAAMSSRPFVPPGWFELGQSVQDAYEATDRTAACCDIEEAAR